MHLVLFKIWFVFSREWEILLFELFCRACIIYHATTWNGGLCYRISYMPAFCLPLFALETISLIDFFLNLTQHSLWSILCHCVSSLYTTIVAFIDSVLCLENLQSWVISLLFAERLYLLPLMFLYSHSSKE
jgi:hypothetical protein